METFSKNLESDAQRMAFYDAATVWIRLVDVFIIII
jgi:hypothetical protein